MTARPYVSKWHSLPPSRLAAAVKQADSLGSTLKLLGFSSASEGSQLALLSRLAILRCSTAHWKQPLTKEWVTARWLKVYDRSTRAARPAVYRAAYNFVKVGNSCEECGQGGMHNGLPLLLEIDHINGDSYDCRVENLRRLCPNCHTQQETSIAGSAAIMAYEAFALTLEE